MFTGIMLNSSLFHVVLPSIQIASGYVISCSQACSVGLPA